MQCRSYHPVSQPSLWHCTSPITSQPAMTDWLRLSGLPSSWFTWSFCLYARWSASFKTSRLDDTVSYSFTGQSRKPQTDFHFSFNSQLKIKTKWLSAFTVSPSLTSLFMRQCNITLESPRCGACTKQNVNILNNSGRQNKKSLELCELILLRRKDSWLLVIIKAAAAWEHTQLYLLLHTVIRLDSVMMDYNYIDKS